MVGGWNKRIGSKIAAWFIVFFKNVFFLKEYKMHTKKIENEHKKLHTYKLNTKCSLVYIERTNASL